MSEAPTHIRVLVRNNSEAPQGIYEAGASAGDAATYIPPKGRKTVLVDEATLKHLRDNPEVFGVFDAPAEGSAEEAPRQAAEPEKNGEAPKDEFDKMSDEELRAFVTDRGQKPHNFAGRAKLLIMARGPADAAEPAETV